MADEFFTTLLGDDLDTSIFEVTAGSGYADGTAISSAANAWFFGYIIPPPPAPGPVTTIPASTGGWKMGGAGVWVSTIPSATVITPAVDPLTGYFLGGGVAPGEPEVVSTFPPADTIPPEDEADEDVAGFLFCGEDTTGDAATAFPASEVIEATGGFALGGAGVWSQVKPEDIPSTVLVGSGGFELSGSGFPTAPGVTPTATVIVSTGGFKFGGVRVPPVEVTYPGSADRTIEAIAAFEMGGEGIWGGSLPPSTVIVSAGAVFVLAGEGIAATKSPPTAIITGDGGFALSGTGWAITSEVTTWVLTGKEFAASIYANFDFQAYAQFRGKYYGAGPNGIYILEGADDDGEAIHPGVRLAPTNLGTHNQKRLRVVSIGNQSNGARVRVRAGDREGVSDVVKGHAFIARNLQDAVFIVDILNFDELSHLEIVPLIMGW